MKRLVVGILTIVCFGMMFGGCTQSLSNVVRIHIRANSNSVSDQNIKLVVRDGVIDYITPLIANCNNGADVKNTLGDNLTEIADIANNILLTNGYSYKSCVQINNEYFPSRKYNDKVFKADYYDALIVSLGEGCGDNWWCVAYPPLCFIGEDVGDNNVRYKSKIIELINKFFGGK